MAEFEQDLQCSKPSLPFSEINTDIEMINQFTQPNASMMGLGNFNITDFTVDNFLGYQQQPEYQAAGLLANDLPGTTYSNCLTELPTVHTMITSTRHVFHESKKRKVMELSTTSSESNNSAKKNSLEKGKKRSNEKEQDKQEEVIHVRAKRGQATDNHSLAERVRRQKINYKLRCLQDLVPGCHKAMGMAVMLDEIINYVHSLKNQVEFLSTELQAACSSYELVSRRDETAKAKGTNSHHVHAMEYWGREQYGEQTRFHTTWPL